MFILINLFIDGLQTITRRTFKYFLIYFIPLIVILIANIILDTIAGIRYNNDNIMSTVRLAINYNIYELLIFIENCRIRLMVSWNF